MVRFAMICMSNQNRSMEAHLTLKQKGFNVDSYGTNSIIKIPGPAADKPNTYQFGVSYEEIYQDLMRKDPNLYLPSHTSHILNVSRYTANGLLMLIDRNRRIKEAPQRFQETTEQYDVIVTCEERCFDLVCEDFMAKGLRFGRPVHIINFDIKDNPEDATVGARAILALAQRLEACSEGQLDDEIDRIIADFQGQSSHPMLYTVHYY